MKLRSNSGELNGFLDAGSHIKGELHFEDTFRIDGKLTGTAISEGDLVVGAGGEVDGEVRTARVFISGTVRGRIQAARRVEITSQGRVFAEIDTPSLVMEDGALFEGQCTMRAHAQSAAAGLGPKPVAATRER
jgi:cytoskeletal protein CcmA (bactofilin family)